MATVGIDFFRVDRSGATRRLLLLAGLLVVLGATLIGAHLVRGLTQQMAHLVSLAGGVTVLAGLVLGFGAMAMLLFENVYLLIREDGLLCHDNGKETAIPWSELEGVSLDDEKGFVRFTRKEPSSSKADRVVRWFAGENAKELHAKVEEAKRKALHGLLKVAQ